MSILMLVGNGLTIDFNWNVVAASERLDTSKPLHWHFPIRAADNLDAFDVFMELREAIAFTRTLQPQLTDFEIISELSGISPITPQYGPLVERVRDCGGRWGGQLGNPRCHPLIALGMLLRHELRLFLNAAFLHFHDVCTAQDSSTWQWSSWFQAHYPRISLLCSLNYDLLAELALRPMTQLEYLISENAHHTNGLKIFKPHGSINYRMHPNAIAIGKSIYEGGYVFERNDCPIIVVGDDQMHAPKIAPDLVLPMEYSKMMDFQCIACGYRHIAAVGTSSDHCVLADLSYWEQDRPELDLILGALRPETMISVVNPNPDPTLMSFLRDRFRDVRRTGTSPPPI